MHFPTSLLLLAPLLSYAFPLPAAAPLRAATSPITTLPNLFTLATAYPCDPPGLGCILMALETGEAWMWDAVTPDATELTDGVLSFGTPTYQAYLAPPAEGEPHHMLRFAESPFQPLVVEAEVVCGGEFVRVNVYPRDRALGWCALGQQVGVKERGVGGECVEMEFELKSAGGITCPPGE